MGQLPQALLDTFGHLRSLADDFVKVGSGFIAASQHVQGHPHIEMGLSEIGLAPQGLLEVRYSSF